MPAASLESQGGLTADQEPEFKIYLERSGVLDLLTNALSCMFKDDEKSPNSMEFIRNKIVAASYNPGAQKLDELSKRVLSLQQTVEKLQEDNRKLRILLGLAESPTLYKAGGSSAPEATAPLSPNGGSSRAKTSSTAPNVDHSINSSRSISKGPGTKQKK